MTMARHGNCTNRLRRAFALIALLAMAGCAGTSSMETTVSGNVDVGVGIQR